MTAATSAGRAARRELAVFVRCHEVVCAIATRFVTRLALPEEVVVRGPIVEAFGVRHAAWNLGERLGLAPLEAAWVLLRVSNQGLEVPIALATGTCLVVQALPRRVALPAELFATRHGAVAGAFAATAAHGGALYGLDLDLPRLWDTTELASSASLLRIGGAA